MTTNSPGAGGRWADHRQVPTLKRNLWASTPVRLTGSSRCPDCTASRILSMTASQKGCFGREARMALHTNTPSRFSSNLAWIWGSVLRNPGNLTMRQARDCLSSSLRARFSFSKKKTIRFGPLVHVQVLSLPMDWTNISKAQGQLSLPRKMIPSVL